MIAHINIGSNIGDSRSAIERAVAAVFALSEGGCRRSDIIESKPWGFDSPHPFLNIGIEIETTLQPLQLLRHLRQIERTISDTPHRNPDGTYRDRPIDLDLIFLLNTDSNLENLTLHVNLDNDTLGDPKIAMLRINTPELTLPHPRAHLRDFVLLPIRQLHPLTYPDLLASLSPLSLP